MSDEKNTGEPYRAGIEEGVRRCVTYLMLYGGSENKFDEAAQAVEDGVDRSVPIGRG